MISHKVSDRQHRVGDLGGARGAAASKREADGVVPEPRAPCAAAGHLGSHWLCLFFPFPEGLEFLAAGGAG